MIVPAILAALVAAPIQDAPQFSQPQSIVEPTRLALTPKVDGIIDTDEWDPLARSNEGETFLQWEPGKLYLAAKMPVDRDLILSLDTRQDGWLVGKDNVEIRVRVIDGKGSVVVRTLDATQVAGPKWIDHPAFSLSSTAMAKIDGSNVTVEASIIDPGLAVLPTKDNEKFLVRADVVAQSSQLQEPFQPRVGALIKLAMQRASALPAGLKWNVEENGRTLTPGNSTKIRFTFSTKDEISLKKLEIKPLGALSERVSTLGVPFPAFDKKGRAFVDYETRTAKDAPAGYHLLNGTLTTGDGAPGVIQASYRVAPTVEFDIADNRISLKSGTTSLKIPFYVKSNTQNRLDGSCSVETPSGWEILKGDDKGFIIYNSRAGIRRVLTVTVPAGVSGTFPIRFTATIGPNTFTETRWLTILTG